MFRARSVNILLLNYIFEHCRAQFPVMLHVWDTILGEKSTKTYFTFPIRRFSWLFYLCSISTWQTKVTKKIFNFSLQCKYAQFYFRLQGACHTHGANIETAYLYTHARSISRDWLKIALKGRHFQKGQLGRIHDQIFITRAKCEVAFVVKSFYSYRPTP